MQRASRINPALLDATYCLEAKPTIRPSSPFRSAALPAILPTGGPGPPRRPPHGSAGLELRRFRLLDLCATDTDI